MDILNPFQQVSYALQKSLGLWLSVWAIRFSPGINCKLRRPRKNYPVGGRRYLFRARFGARRESRVVSCLFVVGRPSFPMLAKPRLPFEQAV
jgi:hypothetical protein